MVRFRCMHCRFSYAPKSVRKTPPDICGNCGRSGTLQLEPDAERILRDVNEIQ